MIEQLRVGRWLAARRSRWAFHQALAEVMLPDPIHHHARGEWIAGSRHPLGQFEAALPEVSSGKLPPPRTSKTARHFPPRLVRLAWLNPGIARRAFTDRVGQLERAVDEQRIHFLLRLLGGAGEFGGWPRSAGLRAAGSRSPATATCTGGEDSGSGSSQWRSVGVSAGFTPSRWP